ncbi:prolipoprotein diacylglyceryl transferase, partial [bacterium]|nr:prolipoprotein diacylglyceryl transferase [bacterium]
MHPVLFTIHFDVATASAFFVFFTLVAFVLALRARPARTTVGAASGRALASALLASLTLGLLGSKKPEEKEGADLFLPGAAGTLAGTLPLAVALARGSFDVPVSSYPVTMALGFLAAIVLGVPAGARRGIARAHMLDIAILCILVGPIGSRVFFVAEFWDEDFADRPARLVTGELSSLSPADELEARTATASARTAFTGSEASWNEVLHGLSTLERGGVRARILSLERRRGSEVEHRVRGIALETAERGSAAQLAVSGAAAPKLGFRTDVIAHGLDVPWTDALKLWNGGIVFYGGLLACTIASIIYIRARGYRWLVLGDVVAPLGALGLVFGRTGCFLNGCCWGREADASFPLAIRFPVGSFAWLQHAKSVLSPAFDSTLDSGRFTPDLERALRAAAPGLLTGSFPVHPVQLYSIALDFALFLVV